MQVWADEAMAMVGIVGRHGHAIRSAHAHGRVIVTRWSRSRGLCGKRRMRNGSMRLLRPVVPVFGATASASDDARGCARHMIAFRIVDVGGRVSRGGRG